MIRDFYGFHKTKPHSKLNSNKINSNDNTIYYTHIALINIESENIHIYCTGPVTICQILGTFQDIN
jgi:hypothetical protein